MSEKQPNDVDEEVPVAKSAEDRKAASALANLDARDDAGPARDVDEKAVSEAMKSLAGHKSAAGVPVRTAGKNVKVDPADVTLLVDELDLTKVKATELLKAHEGDAVKAMRAFVQVKV